MPRPIRLVTAAALASALLIAVAGAAIAAPAGMKAYRGAGAFTQAGISVTFDAKIGSSSTTWAPAKGSIHLVLDSLDFWGTAVCAGTSTTGNRWAQYVSTNLGSTGNPELEALWINYRDESPDSWTGFQSAADTDCAALAAFSLHDAFQPMPIDSGWITVR